MKNIIAFIGHRHWLRLGLRYRLSRMIKTDMSYVDRHLFFFGGVELQEMRFLTRYLTPSSVVLDIGANVGSHSLFFSKYVKKVYAFEPNERAYKEILKRTKDINVISFPYALGDKNGTATLYEPPLGDTDMSSLISGYSARNTSAREVNLFIGDNFTRNLKVDLIKIDVEGYEKEVLVGLTRTINRDRPVIYMEYMETTQKKFGSLSGLLSSLPGYKLFTISVNRPKGIIFNDPRGKLIPYNGSKDILLLPEH